MSRHPFGLSLLLLVVLWLEMCFAAAFLPVYSCSFLLLSRMQSSEKWQCAPDKKQLGLVVMRAAKDIVEINDDDASLSVVASGQYEPDALLFRQVYPAMIQYRNQYGHPNIPLGSKEGRTCETLRRMQIQNKLTRKDYQALNQLGFRWHSLEDVYRTSDFDQLFARLLLYGQEHDRDLSPPKKYDPDPELGAWVTGIRRVGRDDVLPHHRQQLDEIQFEWISKRKCGSNFMTQYRAIQQTILDNNNNNNHQSHPLFWLEQPQNRRWVHAQQLAFQKGNLSETRVHYMEQLLGSHWATLDLE